MTCQPIYHDDYSACVSSVPADAVSRPAGMCTATLHATLGCDDEQPLLTLNYFDRNLRLIRCNSKQLDNSSIISTFSYSPSGLTTAATESLWHSGHQVSHSLSHSYDGWGRLKNSVLHLPKRDIRTVDCRYNSLGQLSLTYGYNGDISRRLSYNVNGWLTQWSTPFYTQRLYYAMSDRNPSYSGNIARKQTLIGSGGSVTYDYKYDGNGRLTEAAYSDSENREADFSASFEYDAGGSPTRIIRKGLTDVGVYGTVNDITTSYSRGQVQKSNDQCNPTVLEGNLSNSAVIDRRTTHEYDNNGNLISDITRDISSITYNILDLPQTISFKNGSTLSFVYRSDGVKLREIRRRKSFSITDAGPSGMITETTDYMGAYEIENGTVRRLMQPGGFVTLDDGIYHHYIHDYQGNVLALVNTSTRSVEQFTDYYPYGLPHGNHSGAGLNRRKYSAKELVTFAGLNDYDYHARWRNTNLPIFSTQDPLGEKRRESSFYIYCGGDPINKIDPDGRDEWEISKEGEIVNKIATKQHDAFFILDNDGNRIDNAVLTMPYGSILASHANLNWGEKDFNLFKIKGDYIATDLFEFLAKHTDVEWTRAATGQIKNGYSGLNFLTTTMETDAEAGMKYLINKQLKYNYYIRSITHNHPNNVGRASGQKDDSSKGLSGDIPFAKDVVRVLGYTPDFYIYLPAFDEYCSFRHTD